MRNPASGNLWLACLALLLVLDAEAQEWTRFRGPNGTGVADAKSLPVQWTDDDYSWKIALPGIGHSSPVVWGDRVFLLSAEPGDATRYVLCVDARSGDLAWQQKYASTPHRLHARNTFASSSPAVDDRHVYVAWSTPESLTCRALDHEGHEQWSRDLGTYVSEHGFGASPLVYEDLVILSNSQQADELEPGQTPGKTSMVALDRETGAVRWSQPLSTNRVCYGTPCIYRPENGPPQLICYNTGDGVFSLDPKTGQRNWSVAVFTMRNVNSPVVVGDLVYGSNGSGGGGNYMVAVRIGEEPREVFRVKKYAPYVSTPVARGDLLFLFYDQGIVSCLRATDGEVFWTQRVSRSFSGSPVLVHDRVYCIDDDGNVIVLAAEQQFKELARNPLGEPSRATPAVSGGRMFLRTASHLFCIGGDAASLP